MRGKFLAISNEQLTMSKSTFTDTDWLYKETLWMNNKLCHFDRSEERAERRNLAVNNDKISRLQNLLRQIFPLEMTC